MDVILSKSRGRLQAGRPADTVGAPLAVQPERAALLVQGDAMERPATPSDPAAPLPRRSQVTREDRVRAGLEVLLVTLGIELLSELALAAVVDLREVGQLGSARLTAVVLAKNLALPAALIWLFLRLEGRGFRELGFGRRPPLGEVLLGLSLFPAILVSAGLLAQAVLWLFPQIPSVEVNPLLDMIQGPEDVLLFVVMSVLGGGLGEETLRAFVLRRFERYLGGMVVGLLVWSTVFGLMHQIQGWDKAVAVGFLGLLLGLIYAWRRDPLAPITAHAAFDVAQTLLAYFSAGC